MSIELKPMRRSPEKITIRHAEDSPCPSRQDEGNHELVSNEVGRLRSRLVTRCIWCEDTWARIDAMLNPKAKGRLAPGA